jgi:hypothetical protein
MFNYFFGINLILKVIFLLIYSRAAVTHLSSIRVTSKGSPLYSRLTTSRTTTRKRTTRGSSFYSRLTTARRRTVYKTLMSLIRLASKSSETSLSTNLGTSTMTVLMDEIFSPVMEEPTSFVQTDGSLDNEDSTLQLEEGTLNPSTLFVETDTTVSLENDALFGEGSAELTSGTQNPLTMTENMDVSEISIYKFVYVTTVGLSKIKSALTSTLTPPSLSQSSAFHASRLTSTFERTSVYSPKLTIGSVNSIDMSKTEMNTESSEAPSGIIISGDDSVTHSGHIMWSTLIKG